MKWTISKITIVMSLFMALGGSLFAVTSASAAAPVTNVTTIAPNGTALTGSTWAFTEDDTPVTGALNSVVNDPINQDGSLELATPDTASHVVIQTAATGALSSLSNVSYQTFLVQTGGVASVSLQVGIDCVAPVGSTPGSGFTTFVYEPYEQTQPVVPGEWQTWDASATGGIWWSTHDFSATAGGGVGSGDALGGQSRTETFSNLISDFDNACPAAGLLDFGVGMGSSNPGTQAWTDNLMYTTSGGSENWNFKAPVTATPSTATNVNTVAPFGTALTGSTWAFTEDDTPVTGALNSVVNDPINQDGSLELATPQTASHVVIQTAATGALSSLSNVSYQTFLVQTGGVASVSLQVGIDCVAPVGSTPGSGFTTFVFEPYEQTQTVVPGEWQTWDASASGGVWWSTHDFSPTAGGGVGSGAGDTLGGQARTETFSNLVSDFDNACPAAGLLDFGVGMGSSNPGTQAWTDNLMYSTSAGSENWNFVGANTVPGAPTIGLAVPGDGSASVAFTAPVNSGGSTITGYTVTAIDLTNALRGGETATGTGSPIVISGLTDGDTYEFKVSATNETGTSLQSAPSNAVVPSTTSSGGGGGTGGTGGTGTGGTGTGGTGTSPSGTGAYDLVGSDGGVFVFGQPGTGFYGSLPGMKINVHNIVGIVPTTDGKGYFLVGSDGGVFAFGDAPFENSLPGEHVSVNDIVGIVPTKDDKGYFLVGRDGGVFAFGDAPFENSLPGQGTHVNNIVGIAATPDDGGYWVVASSGQVYALGDAKTYGSATGGPVVAITATPDGGGYWLTTANGGVDTFGDAGFYKSLPGINVNVSNIVSLVPSTDGQGYLLVGADGGLFAFGDATFPGSLPGLGIHVTNIVGAVPVA